MLQLKFNKKIYKKKAVQEAVSAYAKLADPVLVEDPNYFKLRIGKIDVTYKDILVDEFSNYVLGATKKCL